jgi:Rha family phage regulatory protein
MSTSALVPQLTIVNGRPVATSLNVADVFGKRHDNVVRAIKRLDIPKEFNLLNFEEITYIDDMGRNQPMYHITRDGFTLLAMGFTGKEAMRFKLAYIEAFNRMEAELIELATGSRDKKIDISHTHTRGTFAPGGLDIRYTLDLTKVIMRPNRTGIELLERLTGIPLTDVLPDPYDDTCPVRRFIEECYVREESNRIANRILLKDVYSRFIVWYEENIDNSGRKPITMKGVAARIRAAGVPVVPSGGKTWVVGLAIRDKEVR